MKKIALFAGNVGFSTGVVAYGLVTAATTWN